MFNITLKKSQISYHNEYIVGDCIKKANVGFHIGTKDMEALSFLSQVIENLVPGGG